MHQGVVGVVKGQGAFAAKVGPTKELHEDVSVEGDEPTSCWSFTTLKRVTYFFPFFALTNQH